MREYSMQGYNVIAVYNETSDKWLMCRRKKNPYLGLLNLVGGKIEVGEVGLEAAYRELEEETAITPSDIVLSHLMDFTLIRRSFLKGMRTIYIGQS